MRERFVSATDTHEAEAHFAAPTLSILCGVTGYDTHHGRGSPCPPARAGGAR